MESLFSKIELPKCHQYAKSHYTKKDDVYDTTIYVDVSQTTGNCCKEIRLISHQDLMGFNMDFHQNRL